MLLDALGGLGLSEKRETRKLNLCLVSFCEKLCSQLLIGLSFRIYFRSVVYKARIVKNVDAESSEMLIQNRQKC